MEMTFPHHAMRQNTVDGAFGHLRLLDSAILRQASSSTAKAMTTVMLSQRADQARDSDPIAQRMLYFGAYCRTVQAPYGAFSTANRGKIIDKTKSEADVYQSASTNIKAHDLDVGRTGEQSKHVGHGASRTL